MCKYHDIFIPKYRQKMIYNKYKADLRDILKQLCNYKGIKNYRRPFNAGSRPYVSKHTAQIECIRYGIFERKKYVNDV